MYPGAPSSDHEERDPVLYILSCMKHPVRELQKQSKAI